MVLGVVVDKSSGDFNSKVVLEWSNPGYGPQQGKLRENKPVVFFCLSLFSFPKSLPQSFGLRLASLDTQKTGVSTRPSKTPWRNTPTTQRRSCGSWHLGTECRWLRVFFAEVPWHRCEAVQDLFVVKILQIP